MISHGIRLVQVAGKDAALKYIEENLYIQHNPRFRILIDFMESGKLVDIVSSINSSINKSS